MARFDIDPALADRLAELCAMSVPTHGQKPMYSAEGRRLRSSYNEVSEALDRALALDDHVWERAYQGQVSATEQMITDALACAVDVNCHQDTAVALRLQRTMLARQPVSAKGHYWQRVRDYYWERPLQVISMPRGRLAPDLVLDGRIYHPDPPVPNVFVAEVKYLADWQRPYAQHLFGTPTDEGYDPVTLWGMGHDDRSGRRVPHVWGNRDNCDAVDHHSVGGGLYVASACQLDVYVAYASQVLGALGMADVPGAPLRVCGLLVDAWAREVDADLAVTWQRWITVSFADLLAEAYGALSTCPDGSPAADYVKVLLAILLQL